MKFIQTAKGEFINATGIFSLAVRPSPPALFDIYAVGFDENDEWLICGGFDSELNADVFLREFMKYHDLC